MLVRMAYAAREATMLIASAADITQAELEVRNAVLFLSHHEVR